MGLSRRELLLSGVAAGIGAALPHRAQGAEAPMEKKEAVLRISSQEGVIPGKSLEEKLDKMEKWGIEGLEIGSAIGREESLPKALEGRKVKVSAVCMGSLGGRLVTFVPHLVTLDRGLMASVHARLRPGTTAAAVAGAFAQAYAAAPFVRLTGDQLPEIKHVAHTNFCDIGWRVDEAHGRLFAVSVIDNLVKGAAGQAIQNFNVMFGLDERAGLL